MLQTKSHIFSTIWVFRQRATSLALLSHSPHTINVLFHADWCSTVHSIAVTMNGTVENTSGYWWPLKEESIVFIPVNISIFCRKAVLCTYRVWRTSAARHWKRNPDCCKRRRTDGGTIFLRNISYSLIFVQYPKSFVIICHPTNWTWRTPQTPVRLLSQAVPFFSTALFQTLTG